jgi:hypothetical protein
MFFNMDNTSDAKINIDSLVDIRGVKIDLSQPVEKRKQSYRQQIVNPNLYRCGDTVIRVSHCNNGVKMKDLMVQYLVSKQAMAL